MTSSFPHATKFIALHNFFFNFTISYVDLTGGVIMSVSYVGNSCLPELKTTGPFSSESPSTMCEASQLPMTDAPAYVSGSIPIPEKSPFLTSRLFENPSILALDFQGAPSMERTLSRMSWFVEVHGKKSGAELTPPPSYRGSGYDLKSSDIADFLNECGKQKEPLLPNEQQLVAQLLSEGILVKMENGQYLSPKATALIGMSRDLSPSGRKLTFMHEYSHALYFVDPVFRAVVSSVWASLPLEVQRFIAGALMASDYPSGEQWLLETETQAFLTAPALSGDGLINALLWADERCKENESTACEDFRAYRGDIRELLLEVHERYAAVSQSRIPSPTQQEPANQEAEKIKPRDVRKTFPSGKEILENLELFLKNSQQDPTQNFFGTSKPISPDTALEALQMKFDERHGVLYCRPPSTRRLSE
jgi:hypothetical protein